MDTDTPGRAFAARLKSLAAEAGLSANRLADAAGLSRRTVQGWWAGRTPELPPLRAAADALAAALGRPVGDVLAELTRLGPAESR